MKYKEKFNILTYIMSLISFVFGFIGSEFGPWFRYVLYPLCFTMVMLSLIFFLLGRILYKRNHILKKGLKLLHNAKSQVIIFGNDLSFIVSYFEALNKLTVRGRTVDIYIPEETYHSENENLHMILNILNSMKVSIYTYNSKSNQLKCTILDPDCPEVQIYKTKKICTNPMEDTYKYKYMICNRQQNVEECELTLITYRALANNNTVRCINFPEPMDV